MRFQPLCVSKEYQQFRWLAKKLSTLLEDGSFSKLSIEKQADLKNRLLKFYRYLSTVLSKSKLRKTLAASALLLGLSFNAIQAQNFAPPVESPFGLDDTNVNVMSFGDIDNDGDLDMFLSRYSASYPYSRVFAYQENTGTPVAPQFAASVENAFGVTASISPTNVATADIDNDGDLDLFFGAIYFEGGIQIEYFENTGSPEVPAFSNSSLNPFGITTSEYITFVQFADLDNDSDLDLLMTQEGYYGDQFLYQENNGTTEVPNFANGIPTPFGLDNTLLYRVVHTVGDLDLDGDFDVLASGNPYDYLTGYPRINYFENTGSPEAPAFADVVESPFNIPILQAVFIAPTLVDIDDDGDLDILATKYINDYDQVILFFENLGDPVSVQHTALAESIALYPTIADNIINWELELSESTTDVNFQLINIKSQVLQNNQIYLSAGANQGQIDVSNFAPGIYWISFSNEAGAKTTKQFIVK